MLQCRCISPYSKDARKRLVSQGWWHIERRAGKAAERGSGRPSRAPQAHHITRNRCTQLHAYGDIDFVPLLSAAVSKLTQASRTTGTHVHCRWSLTIIVLLHTPCQDALPPTSPEPPVASYPTPRLHASRQRRDRPLCPRGGRRASRPAPPSGKERGVRKVKDDFG